MNNFTDQVYRLVALIPTGKVATYGQIAAMLGNPLAARRVGEAMAHAPENLDIPCHRVVNHQGDMAPAYAFGGADRQRAQLAAEGVIFRANGRIDLAGSLWKPDFLRLPE
jgi:methylated-DNA-protein-cysteine methyltransferase related protein